MMFFETELPGVVLIEPKIFGDHRGYFFECYQRERYVKAGITAEFIQDNESKSSYGVVRGLHFQIAPYTQAKLVRVISGRVLDVVVDVRRNSPTFGRHVAVELTGENKRQLYVPRGFAHGFAVLSAEAVFAYKCDNFYAPECERGIAFNDPVLGIDWGVPEVEMVLSERDLRLPPLDRAELFDINDPGYLR